jgi:pimeloyl-ACP methyl ester carboxylesterase
VRRETHHQATSRLIALGDGRALKVREWPGRGRPLVLLHGLLDSGAGWEELARVIPHRCLAIDLPGFGDSDPPRRPRLSAYAEDIVEALGLLDVRSLTLVGHSLGGGVATAVAERMRREVEALVLCAPAGYGRIPLAELATLPLVRALAVGSLPHLVTRSLLLDRVYASLVTSGIGPSEELRRRLAADASRVGPGLRAAVEALAAAGRSGRAFHRRAVVYDGPVSAVWGDRDALVSPSHIHGVLAALPQAEAHLWHGMGHHPQRERPAELAELVQTAHQTTRTELACERRTPASARHVDISRRDALLLGAARRAGQRDRPRASERPRAGAR